MVVRVTFKYDDPRLKCRARAAPSCDIFNLEFITFQCRTHYRASPVYCLPFQRPRRSGAFAEARVTRRGDVALR